MFMLKLLNLLNILPAFLLNHHPDLNMILFDLIQFFLVDIAEIFDFSIKLCDCLNVLMLFFLNYL